MTSSNQSTPSEETRRAYINTLEELYAELRKHNKDMGVFLSQSISVAASDDCMRAITEDMRHWIEYARQKGAEL